nr:immunoglobulin heavy chain junction region [Mus musculus]
CVRGGTTVVATRYFDVW